jgi:hypothetical protein
MILVVQGSRNFEDYAVFLNGLFRAMGDMEKNNDKELTIYSAGPRRVNNMAAEFASVSEDGLRARGIKFKLRRVPIQWMKEHINEVDYFAYFCKRKESVSDLVEAAEAKDVQVGVFRF